MLLARPSFRLFLRPRRSLPMRWGPQPQTQRRGPRLLRSRPGSRPQERLVCSNPARTLTASHSGPALTDLLTFGFTLRRTWLLKHGFGGERPRLKNLTEHEALKRTFHDAANRCHQNGTRCTLGVFDGHAGSWGDSARNTCHLDLPTARHQPLIAHRATSTSNWLSASLRLFIETPRVPFYDVSA